MARVLGRVRISRLTEESTSIQRQRDLIEDWASKNGHEIVAWAEDADVSGSVSPFDAPALGRFLTEEGARGWDIMVAWKLDRLARNAVNMHKLFGWIQENEKQLVCISDNIDLSTWVGRLVAGVIAGVAEGELENLTDRVSAGMRELRQTGRFQGGAAPFGYKSAPKEGGGRTLVKDPEQQEVLQWIFEQALKNRTFVQIAEDLNSNRNFARNEYNGKTTQGWHATTIAAILKNKAYLGWTTYEGKPVLDNNGEPVKRCEPSISVEDFNRIQELCSRRGFRGRAAPKMSPLHGVIECWECGHNLHYHRMKTETAHNYWCRYHENRKGKSINAKVAEDRLDELVRELIGELPILEKRISTIRSSEEELEEARATYREIASFLSTVPDEASRKTIFEQLENVNRRIQELEKAVHSTDGTEWVDTGVTFGQRWEELDAEGRRLLLTSAGIRYRARTIVKGTRWKLPILETELIVPEELQLAARTKGFNLHEIEQQQRQQWWESLTEEERRSWLDAGIPAPGTEEGENA